MPEPKASAARGRKFDYARDRAPVTARRPLALVAPHWQSFTAAATPPRIPDDPGIIVDEEWEKENLGDLEGPWNPAGMDTNSQGTKGFWLFSAERRSATSRRIHVCPSDPSTSQSSVTLTYPALPHARLLPPAHSSHLDPHLHLLLPRYRRLDFPSLRLP